MIVILTVGGPRDNSHYLMALLRAFGWCNSKRLHLDETCAGADPAGDVVVLTGDAPLVWTRDFIEAGGRVVAIRPVELAPLADLRPVAEHDGEARLRLTTPLCHGARGEPLWTLGPRTFYEGAEPAAVLAYLFEPHVPDTEAPAIVQRQLGDGSLTVFAYDPALCIARLRQGFPERVGILPPGEKIPRSIHLHQPHPPQDAAWRPTADLHAALFCEVIGGLLRERAPVPALWHLPGGSPAMLVFSGDEDVSAQADNQQEMADVEAHGGHMSLYVIQDNTSMTPELAAQYEARGHTISVHPNLVPTAGEAAAVQLTKARDDVLEFKRKFGLPVYTVRNHNTMWPGYLSIPELWEELGIGMDGNCMATLYRMAPDVGPYVNINAAMPLPYVREDGTLIDVYQQPTHYNDDIFSHPTVDYSQKFQPAQFKRIAARLWEDAARYFHAPLCANFHPCNYVAFATEAGLDMMRGAQQWGAPIWSLDRWHDFCRARASWQATDITWHDNTLTLHLAGTPCEALWVTLPAGWQYLELKRLELNEVEVATASVERFGATVVQAALPAAAAKVTLHAVYG